MQNLLQTREQGEIIANEGDAISADLAMQIERAGVNQVELLVEGKKVRVFSNNMVYLDEYVDFEVEDFPVKKVRKAIIEEIIENAETEDEIKEQLWARIDELAPKHIIIDDMFASVNYCLNLANGIGTVDDIDHLGTDVFVVSVNFFKTNSELVLLVWKEQ